eukprot:scaffold5632_cov146-Skeletonema_marinoi.AAC.15
MHVMCGGDDGNGDEDVPMREDGAGTYHYQGDGDAVMEREGVKDDDKEDCDSDLDDIFKLRHVHV